MDDKSLSHRATNRRNFCEASKFSPYLSTIIYYRKSRTIRSPQCKMAAVVVLFLCFSIRFCFCVFPYVFVFA
jgi:hypothetical protein